VICKNGALIEFPGVPWSSRTAGLLHVDVFHKHVQILKELQWAVVNCNLITYSYSHVNCWWEASAAVMHGSWELPWELCACICYSKHRL